MSMITQSHIKFKTDLARSAGPFFFILRVTMVYNMGFNCACLVSLLSFMNNLSLLLLTLCYDELKNLVQLYSQLSRVDFNTILGVLDICSGLVRLIIEDSVSWLVPLI